LRQLRGWLKNCRVTEAVIESTGQYWRAVWNVLEEEIPRLVLVNPAHVKALVGRKTDRIDSRRLARYLENGDLDGSFVPPRETRELRDLTRWRVHLVEDLNRVKNRISQMCEAGNIKVSSVASDLFGVSGRRMLDALVEGTRGPGWMADYAKGSLRGKKKQLEQALEGTFSEHQRWMLKAQLRHLKLLDALVEEVEKEIELRMKGHAEAIRRLATIPGVDRVVAWTLIAELGTDMTVFPDADHAASWAGLCPGNRRTAGKRLSGRTRKANPYLRRDLCQSAWAASHAHHSYLAGLYQRFRVRLGHNKAIFAVAPQILRTAYTMLLRSEDYRELGGDYFDRRNKPRVVHRILERLKSLGYAAHLEELDPEPASQIAEVATTAISAPAPAPPKPKRGRPCKCAARGIPCTHRSENSKVPDTQPTDNAPA
jgi:transposase